MECTTAFAVAQAQTHATQIAAQLVALGIDQEQAAAEQAASRVINSSNIVINPTAADAARFPYCPSSLPDAQSKNPSSTMTDLNTQRSAQPHPRSTRTSARLAQLPRLGSQRNVNVCSRKDRIDGQAVATAGLGEAQDEAGAHSPSHDETFDAPPSDDDTVEGNSLTTETEETDDYSDGSSSIGSQEDEHVSGMPGFLPPPIHSGRRSSSISSDSVAEGRNSRRPSAIVIPPPPSFAHLDPTTPAASTSAAASSSATTSATPLARSGGALQGSLPAFVGRDSWTQFGGGDDETPGWLPTPRAATEISPTGLASTSSSAAVAAVPQRGSVAVAAIGPRSRESSAPRTPQARPLLSTSSPPSASPSDTSYFNILPGSAQSVARGDKNAPPPSPSLITRSRAQSSASMRPIGRTPTLPLRELPPLPPVAPLKLRAYERARSPGQSAAGKATLPVTTPMIVAPPSPRSVAAPVVDDATTSLNSDDGPPSVLASSARTEPDSRKGSDSTVQRQPVSSGVLSSSLTAALPVSPSLLGANLGTMQPSDRLSPLLTTSLGPSSMRPSLYKQQSRSLIDLPSTTARKPFEPTLKGATAEGDATPERTGTKEAVILRAASPVPSTASSTPATGTIRRRRSMFEVGAAPPPYADVHGAQKAQAIMPREEEGKELLPNYACFVHIEGYLPRKMEFSAPGIQAKDRSWRRQYFVLHGTCLRVYRTDLSREGGLAKGDLGQMQGAHVHAEPMNEDGPTPLPVLSSTGERPSRVQAVTTGSNTASKDNYMPGSPPSSSAATTATTTTSSSNASVHTTSGNSSVGGGLHRKVEGALSGTISHINHPFSSQKGTLLKQYTLQAAESGLAADYLKRRHVVRVRAEGEQFLLQTRNDRHVVDWIEAFQAGTNIAQDLERRQMPKFITLPRRRRRRRRDASGAEVGAGAAPASAASGIAGGPSVGRPGETLSSREQAELEEARRRSLMDAGGGRLAISSSTARAASHPPRPLGLPGDESPPQPSDAFDEMLREEHEHFLRQDTSAV